MIGDDGVIIKTQEASIQANNKKEEEQIRVKMVQGAGNGDITKDVIQHYIGDLIETQIIGNGPWIVTGVESGIEYTIDRDGEVTMGDVAVVESENIENKIGKDVLSQTGTVTIQDSLGNYVRVPKGFKIASDSGKNVGEGIVIEDISENQFVWVPVGEVKKKDVDKTETVTIPLGRYDDFTMTSGLKPKQDASKGYVSTTKENGIIRQGIGQQFYEFANDVESENMTRETYDNSKAKDIKEFVKSANTNGGYYIGRYEAGVSGAIGNPTTTNSSKDPEWTGYKAENGKDPIMVCKSGATVWVYITQKKAASLSQNMYGEGVTSDLINSYAWDTAIIFIQQCSTDGSNYASLIVPSNTKKLESAGKSILSTTEKHDEFCKIFDLSGNACEWTTETNTYAEWPCTNRGGNFNGSDRDTQFRDRNRKYDVWASVGFRPVLYL